MPTLGQELRKKREEQGSSLKDISLHTKISLRLLQALEEDRFDLLPGLFFLKGVLRSYVRAIGADERHFMSRLDELMKSLAPAEYEPPFVARAPLRRRALRIALIVVVMAAVIAAGFLVLKSRPAPAPILKRPAAEAPAYKPPETSPAVEAAKVPDPPLKMEMDFTSDTWLNIQADGGLVYEGQKSPGDSAVFTAQNELLLQIGNAGGFTFKLNGKTGRPLGPRGAVRLDVRITPATLADFIDGKAAAPAGR